MTDEELQRRMKEVAMGWEETGEILEQERFERVRNANTARSLEILSGMFDSAVWLHRPNASSGLVEQQEIFMRARR